MGVKRFVLRLAVLGALLFGGLTSAVLAAREGATGGTTTGTTVSTVLTSSAASVLVVSGHGWGHGLGLSQWGAYGYAQHGWTYDRILAHYYTGTTLAPAKVATVRVLLSSDKRTSLNSSVSWSVTDSAGAKTQLDPGVLVLKPNLAIAGQPALQPPFTFVGKQPLLVEGKPYRGKILVSSDGKRLQVIDSVGLEAYLKGVVPSEMPSNWPAETLKAQAVAARSYALANVTKGRGFDLYGDVRSQVYGGVDAETTNASSAVDATKGQIVVYNGKVADTLFFSTSGGRTASAAEATGVAVPYLVPVSDPYDNASPYHNWGPVLLDAARVAKELKLAAPISDVQTTTGLSGRVKTVTVVSDGATQLTLTGSQLRGALELRSTWFQPAFLRLLPAAKTMTYGGAVSITGLARGAAAVSLEAKPAGLDWAPAGDLVLDANGAFSAVEQPQLTTQYRLAWGDVRAGLARISVAPRVDAQATPAGAQGTIKPVAAGAAVQLQQQAGAGWTTVTATVTDAAGAWSFTGPLQPGTYRIRCAPGHGLAPGVSAALLVQ
ncbi:MAG: SpoIID/LytB domain-containing protein [Actinomycetota bacterium]|nr:SpoIID/LytB domain-containing protein [Actinomycetota bacterium]